MKISRRAFLKQAGLLTGASAGGCALHRSPASPVLVNDAHTPLNPTWVRRGHTVRSVRELKRVILTARREKRALSVGGGRHAGGGQQFQSDWYGHCQNLFAGKGGSHG